MKSAAILLTVALAVAAAFAADEQAAGVPKLTPDEVEAMRKKQDVVILDVRTPREYAEGHIPGAVNVDVNDVKAFDEKVKALDKGKTYVVHCARGVRSDRAARRMKSQLQFDNLYDFGGGMEAWKKAGKPVETASPAPQQSRTMRYPETRKTGQVDDYHGVKVADPYRWLEDTDSPETRQWIEKQNEVTFGYLKILPQRPWLKDRITSLWNYPKYGLPQKEGGRYFYSKNSGLQNQAVLYVQPATSAKDDAARVLLDPNALSKDGTVAVTGIDITDDGKRMAYAISRAGSDWKELRVRSIDDGSDPDSELIKWAKFANPSWTKDGKGFFYSRYPTPDEKVALLKANRNHQIYYHAVGTTQDKDRLVYQRPDEPEWMMGAGVSEDGRYAVVAISKAGPHNRVYYIDLKDPQKPAVDGSVVKLIDDFEAEYDFVGNDGPVFYFKTDKGAPRGRVVAVDVTKPDRENWKTIVAESPDALETVMMSRDRFVCGYLHNAASQVRFFDLSGKHVKDLELPGLGTVSGPRGKREDDELFYSFTSYLSPPTIYRYDVKSGTTSVFRKPEVNFDPSPLETKQVW
jgi:prolyl oligopeptidase